MRMRETLKRSQTEVEMLRDQCILGCAGLSKKEKDEARRKKTELGAERGRQNGIK